MKFFSMGLGGTLGYDITQECPNGIVIVLRSTAAQAIDGTNH